MINNGGYKSHKWINCIDAYKPVTGDWERCPCCNLFPMEWTFDNGRKTACGCWESKCDHFSIHSESIASVLKRTGGFAEYNSDDLRKNWNHWCKTGEVIFEHASKRNDGRW
jgi:hypothetical protein